MLLCQIQLENHPQRRPAYLYYVALGRRRWTIPARLTATSPWRLRWLPWLRDQ
jgi:hypothetical protein